MRFIPALLILAIPFLAACGQLSGAVALFSPEAAEIIAKADDKAAEATGKGVYSYCLANGNNIPARQAFDHKVKSHTPALPSGKKPGLIIDCDGDDLRDFELPGS